MAKSMQGSEVDLHDLFGTTYDFGSCNLRTGISFFGSPIFSRILTSMRAWLTFLLSQNRVLIVVVTLEFEHSIGQYTPNIPVPITTLIQLSSPLTPLLVYVVHPQCLGQT